MQVKLMFNFLFVFFYFSTRKKNPGHKKIPGGTRENQLSNIRMKINRLVSVISLAKQVININHFCSR